MANGNKNLKLKQIFKYDEKYWELYSDICPGKKIEYYLRYYITGKVITFSKKLNLKLNKLFNKKRKYDELLAKLDNEIFDIYYKKIRRHNAKKRKK